MLGINVTNWANADLISRTITPTVNDCRAQNQHKKWNDNHPARICIDWRIHRSVPLYCDFYSEFVCSSIEYNLHECELLPFTAREVDCTCQFAARRTHSSSYSLPLSTDRLKRAPISLNSATRCSLCLRVIPVMSLAKVFNLFWFNWIPFRIRLCSCEPFFFVYCLCLHETATTSKLFLFKWM